jgi:hypothetical protein
MRGDRRSCGKGGDLPYPLCGRVGDGRELPQAPMGRIERPKLLVQEVELAAGSATSPDEEALVGDSLRFARTGPSVGRRVEVIEGQVPFIIGPLPPLLGGAGQGPGRFCYRHERSPSGRRAGSLAARVCAGIGRSETKVN